MQIKSKESQMDRLEAQTQIAFEFDFDKGGMLFRVGNGTLTFDTQPPSPTRLSTLDLGLPKRPIVAL